MTFILTEKNVLAAKHGDTQCEQRAFPTEEQNETTHYQRAQPALKHGVYLGHGVGDKGPCTE